MTEQRDQVLQKIAALPPEWYVDHPNADRAAIKLIGMLASAPLVPERDVTSMRARADTWVRRPRGRIAGPLTVREVQMLGGLAAGFRYRPLADYLGIDWLTVTDHINSACAKLGYRGGGRTNAAVAHAIREGWL